MSRQNLAELSMLICGYCDPAHAVEVVRLVCKLIDVAETGALEDAGPLPHVEVTRADVVPPAVAAARGGQACAFCHALILGPIVEHRCERKVELGFGRDGDECRTCGLHICRCEPVKGERGQERVELMHEDDKIRVELVTPGANTLGGRELRTTIKSTGAAGADSSADHPITAAASDAQAAPSLPIGPPARASTEAMRVEVLEVRRANGGDLPYGWLTRKAESLGIPYKTLYSRVRVAMHQDLEPVSTTPALPALEHTNSHACWCRKGPNKGPSRWCDLKASPAVLPGLRSRVAPTVRNERFSGERALPDSD